MNAPQCSVLPETAQYGFRLLWLFGELWLSESVPFIGLKLTSLWIQDTHLNSALRSLLLTSPSDDQSSWRVLLCLVFGPNTPTINSSLCAPHYPGQRVGSRTGASVPGQWGQTGKNRNYDFFCSGLYFSTSAFFYFYGQFLKKYGRHNSV